MPETEQPSDEPNVMTTDEVAARLGCTATTVRRRANAGSLPAFKLPGSTEWRFWRDLIEKEAATVPPADALTANEVAGLLRVTPTWVRRKAAAGHLPGELHPRHGWRFQADAIREWVTQHANRTRVLAVALLGAAAIATAATSPAHLEVSADRAAHAAGFHVGHQRDADGLVPTALASLVVPHGDTHVRVIV